MTPPHTQRHPLGTCFFSRHNRQSTQLACCPSHVVQTFPGINELLPIPSVVVVGTLDLGANLLHLLMCPLRQRYCCIVSRSYRSNGRPMARPASHVAFFPSGHVHVDAKAMCFPPVTLAVLVSQRAEYTSAPWSQHPEIIMPVRPHLMTIL